METLLLLIPFICGLVLGRYTYNRIYKKPKPDPTKDCLYLYQMNMCIPSSDCDTDYCPTLADYRKSRSHG